MTRFGLLSTFPPTRCGLATFTSALATALSDDGMNECVVVRVDDLVAAGPSVDTSGVRVVADLRPGNLVSRANAAEVLNDSDVVVVQHEYGIYGGPDGDEILDLLSRITAPTIVVMHTVLTSPTPHQRRVTQEIGALAGVIVAMTRRAATLLVEEYEVPAAKVSLIPHGVDARTATPRARTSPNPVVLTWGLIGPGKGIEWGIRAMALLSDMDPAPIFRVLGQTHPKVVIDQGERYRDSLTSLVGELGLTGRVEIDGRYQESADLAAEVAAADLVLLPYDSRDQATSGVLVEAVAAGKLVIATRFPHSIELLGDGAGLLVDQKHPEQIAAAIMAALGDRARIETALVVARAHAHANSWEAVAQRYVALADELAMVSVGR